MAEVNYTYTLKQVVVVEDHPKTDRTMSDADFAFALSHVFGPGEPVDQKPDGTATTWTWSAKPFEPLPWTTYTYRVFPWPPSIRKEVATAITDVFRQKRWLSQPHYIGKRKLRGVRRHGRLTVKPWGIG